MNEALNGHEVNIGVQVMVNKNKRRIRLRRLPSPSSQQLESVNSLVGKIEASVGKFIGLVEFISQTHIKSISLLSLTNRNKMRRKKLLPLVKVLMYFTFFCIAMMIAGLVPQLDNPLFFFSLSLLLSFIFLRREGKKLGSIGFIPRTMGHYFQLSFGLIIGLTMLILTAIATFFLTGDSWQYVGNINPALIGSTLLNCLLSAFVQEFVFRGYPFQTLYRHYGFWVAQLLVMVPFGLMHVNSTMGMADFMLTMLTTGTGSFLFGLLYARTGKLFLPIGVHTGWNFAQVLIPRTLSNQNETLIRVTETQHNYSFFTVICPYMLCMGIGILIFYYIRIGLGHPNVRQSEGI